MAANDDKAAFEVEYGKLALLLATIIGMVVLLALGRISEGAGLGLIGIALGYAYGNGRLAARGKAPQPLVKRRENAGVDVDLDELADRLAAKLTDRTPPGP